MEPLQDQCLCPGMLCSTSAGVRRVSHIGFLQVNPSKNFAFYCIRFCFLFLPNVESSKSLGTGCKMGKSVVLGGGEGSREGSLSPMKVLGGEQPHFSVRPQTVLSGGGVSRDDSYAVHRLLSCS